MKILIVPDSYKGSLSSREVCLAVKEGIEEYDKTAVVDYIPFADGGEGFSVCLAQMIGGKKVTTDATDIYNNEIKADFYINGNTAVIECAAASGLQKNNNVMTATSYGTGTLIKAAVNMGAKNIILGLGGSGTNDGGAGALSALGAKFFIGKELIKVPNGSDLIRIESSDFSEVNKNINFTFACDVNNIFYGRNGAAYVFSPQKGADKNDVILLDEGLKNFANVLGNGFENTEGTGAAGGLCGGLYKVFGGTIESGFDVLKRHSSLEKRIMNSDIIVTGEGRTDIQTLMGKLPYKISELAKNHGKKCVIISGSSDGTIIGNKVITLVDDETPLSLCLKEPYKILKNKAKYILQ